MVLTTVGGRSYKQQYVRSAQSGGIMAAYVNEERNPTLFVAVAAFECQEPDSCLLPPYRASSSAKKGKWANKEPCIPSVHTGSVGGLHAHVDDNPVEVGAKIILSTFSAPLKWEEPCHRLVDEKFKNRSSASSNSPLSQLPIACHQFHLLQRISLPFSPQQRETPSLFFSSFKSSGEINNKVIGERMQQNGHTLPSARARKISESTSFQEKRGTAETESCEVDKLLWLSERTLGTMSKNGELCIAHSGAAPIQNSKKSTRRKGSSKQETEEEEGGEENLPPVPSLVFPVLKHIHDFTGCTVRFLSERCSCHCDHKDISEREECGMCELAKSKDEMKRTSGSGVNQTAKTEIHPKSVGLTHRDDAKEYVYDMDIVFALERTGGMQACIASYSSLQNSKEQRERKTVVKENSQFFAPEVGERACNGNPKCGGRVFTRSMYFPEERYHCISVAVCYLPVTGITPTKKEEKHEHGSYVDCSVELDPFPNSSLTEQGYLLLVGCSRQSSIVCSTRTLNNLSLVTRKELLLGPEQHIFSLSICTQFARYGKEFSTNNKSSSSSEEVLRVWIAVVVGDKSERITRKRMGVEDEGSTSSITTSSYDPSPSPPCVVSSSSTKENVKNEDAVCNSKNYEENSPVAFSSSSSFSVTSSTKIPFTLRGKDGLPLSVEVEQSVEEIISSPPPLNQLCVSSSLSSMQKDYCQNSDEDEKNAYYECFTDALHRKKKEGGPNWVFGKGGNSSLLSFVVTSPDITRGDGVVELLEWDVLSSSITLSSRQRFVIPSTCFLLSTNGAVKHGDNQEEGMASISGSSSGKPTSFLHAAHPMERGNRGSRPSSVNVPRDTSATSPDRVYTSQFARVPLFSVLSSPSTVRALPHFLMKRVSAVEDGGKTMMAPDQWEAHLALFDSRSNYVVTLALPAKVPFASTSAPSPPPTFADPYTLSRGKNSSKGKGITLTCTATETGTAEAVAFATISSVSMLREGEAVKAMMATPNTNTSHVWESDIFAAQALLRDERLLLGIDEVILSCSSCKKISYSIPRSSASSSSSLSLQQAGSHATSDGKHENDSSRWSLYDAHSEERLVVRVILTGVQQGKRSLPTSHPHDEMSMTRQAGSQQSVQIKEEKVSSLALEAFIICENLYKEIKGKRISSTSGSCELFSSHSSILASALPCLPSTSSPPPKRLDTLLNTAIINAPLCPSSPHEDQNSISYPSPFAFWEILWETYTMKHVMIDTSSEGNSIDDPNMNNNRSLYWRLIRENARAAGTALRELLTVYFALSPSLQKRSTSVSTSAASLGRSSSGFSDYRTGSLSLPSGLGGFESRDTFFSDKSSNRELASQCLMWMKIWEKDLTNMDSEYRSELLALGSSLWRTLLDSISIRNPGMPLV